MTETVRGPILSKRISRRALLSGAGLVAALAVAGLRGGGAAGEARQASVQSPSVTQRHPVACACPVCKRTAPGETLMA